MANHTTPIDVVILANDGCYAMVSVMRAWVCVYVYLPVCLCVFVHVCVFCCLDAMLSSGGADSWRSDGGHPEVDGEVVPSCLV